MSENKALSQGISPIFEVFYLEAIKYVASAAKTSFERLSKAAQDKADPSLTVASAQEALTYVAALSRFFWPARDNGVSIRRGEMLRKAFYLSEDSALKNRSLRDALEHFDERLDEYLLKDFSTGQFHPGPIVATATPLNSTTHVFRLVDPEQSIFVLFNNLYGFDELRQLTEEILEKTQRMLDDGGRLETPDPSASKKSPEMR